MTARGSRFIVHSLPSGDMMLSVAELAIVREKARTLMDRWIKAGEGELSIAYGAYLPQVGVSVGQAATDMRAAVGHGLGFVFGDIVQTLELIDLETRPGLIGADRIAFAALVRAPSEVCKAMRNQQAVLGAFLRYRNLDPATNILNRPGVFAMQLFSPALATSEAGRWVERLNEKQLKRSARWVH
ncbi:hypothetical protein [Burkholderia cenocepacia]|uniref:hypothetical protein n=1 Tax=Burkholderia cenocepacia TaxID=95486 RepID=UPI001B92A299|nr:hypothetical protein [Burkholderia cenocepacia]